MQGRGFALGLVLEQGEEMPPRRTSTKAPGDITGRRAEELRKQADEEEKDRSNELTMATAEAQEKIDNTIVDLSDPEHPVEEAAAPIGTFEDEVDFDEEDVEVIDETSLDSMPMVVIRLNADLKTNIGYGNQYEFEAGRRYRVPYFVAQHLDEKGYVWH